MLKKVSTKQASIMPTRQKSSRSDMEKVFFWTRAIKDWVLDTSISTATITSVLFSRSLPNVPELTGPVYLSWRVQCTWADGSSVPELTGPGYLSWRVQCTWADGSSAPELTGPVYLSWRVQCTWADGSRVPELTGPVYLSWRVQSPPHSLAASRVTGFQSGFAVF